LASVLLVIVVTFITQAVLVLSPGNYADTLRGIPTISPEVIENIVKRYHLDSENVFERYWYWFWPALQGDFGLSYHYRDYVWGLIGERVANTLLLTGSALIFSWGLAIPLGVLGAAYKDRWVDKLCSLISVFGLSIPSVFFSLLMVVFAASTKWFPVGGVHDQIYWSEMSGWEKLVNQLWHLVLPTMVLGTIGMAQYMRQMRSQMIETLSHDYIRTARAKGLSRRRVVLRHALRNAINPLVTLFGFSLAYLLAGTVIVENVFVWPGLGNLILEALQSKDEPLAMAVVTMLALMLVIGNLIADILLAIVDPRIRIN
jgi:peptide/nickel transport system permease protein